jgi:hypothetical protein
MSFALMKVLIVALSLALTYAQIPCDEACKNLSYHIWQGVIVFTQNERAERIIHIRIFILPFHSEQSRQLPDTWILTFMYICICYVLITNQIVEQLDNSYICTHVYIYICIYTYVYISCYCSSSIEYSLCVYGCMYVYIYFHVYIYMHIFTYIYIYTYAYTHTYVYIHVLISLLLLKYWVFIASTLMFMYIRIRNTYEYEYVSVCK